MCDVKEVRGHTTMLWYVPSMCIVASGSSTVVTWLHQVTSSVPFFGAVTE